MSQLICNLPNTKVYVRKEAVYTEVAKEFTLLIGSLNESRQSLGRALLMFNKNYTDIEKLKKMLDLNKQAEEEKKEVEE